MHLSSGLSEKGLTEAMVLEEVRAGFHLMCIAFTGEDAMDIPTNIRGKKDKR